MKQIFGKLIEVWLNMSLCQKYTVNLSTEEAEKLRSLIKTGKSKARSITRAHILLMASVRNRASSVEPSAIQILSKLACANLTL